MQGESREKATEWKRDGRTRNEQAIAPEEVMRVIIIAVEAVNRGGRRNYTYQ